MMKDSKSNPLSAENEIMGVMKAPKAPGEQAMGGVRKSNMSEMGGGLEANMGKAVKCLNKQMERGDYTPKNGSAY